MEFTQDQISQVHREIFGPKGNSKSKKITTGITKPPKMDMLRRSFETDNSSLTENELSRAALCSPSHSASSRSGVALTDVYAVLCSSNSIALWKPESEIKSFNVVLSRNPSHGFGILIRRGLCTQRKALLPNGQFLEARSQVLYAEPGPCGVRCGLLPGDRLITVNGQPVEGLVRNHVIQLIRSSGAQITVQVQPSPELVEFSLRYVVPRTGISVTDTLRVCVRQHLVEMGSLRQLSVELWKVSWEANGELSHHPSGEPNSQKMSSVCMPTENGGHLSPDLNGDSPSISEADANIPVWWSVPDGYKAATLLSTLPNNRCRLLLLPERQEVEADLGDVERANPSSFDRVEDVADLQFPNELSITHTLLQRFGSGQVCTYASGSCLLSINPMTPLNIYSEAVMNLFTGCRHLRDMPPHVFSVAQLVLARLNRSHLKTYHKRNASDGIVTVSQAICLSGRSGSGKTRATLDILSFLLYQSNRVITQWTSNTENQSVPAVCHRVSAERLRALFCMLDAFTCSRVLLNTNANRALRLFSVEYGSLSPRDRDDPGLFICGLTTRLVLFERSRVTERPDGEPNFHIFYYFLAGLDEASRCALFLTDANEPNLFMTKLHRPEDKEAARGYWTQLCHDAELLGFDMDDEWLTGGIARLLAIIYHLGCAGCVEDGIVNGTRADEVDDEDEDSSQPVTTRGFMYMEPAHRAAYLLNCSVEQLSTAVFGRPHTDEGDWSALDCLRGFVQGLYQTVVDTLLMLFNRCLSSHSITGSGTVPVTAQVLLIDPAGIQAPVTKSRNSSGAAFPDLIMNYASDRIGKLFHDTTLSLDAERLLAEGLSVRTVSPTSKTAESLVHLLEGSPETDSDENPGFFELLDRAASEKDEFLLLNRLDELYQAQRSSSKNRDLRTIRRLRKCGLFTLNHSLSSVPVDYQLSNRWLVQCRLSPSSQNAVDLLRRVGVSSLRMFITSLMNQKDYLGPACPTWFNEQSVSAEARKQMDFVINLLESCAKLHCGPSLHHPGSGFNDGGPGCGLHWIHCLLPVINAGLCQLTSDVTFTGQGVPSTLALGPESRALAPGNLMASPARICVNLIRAQLRGLNLVTVLHAARAGYTDRVSLTEFRRYYDSLLTSSARESLKGAVDRGEFTDRKFVSELLSSLRYPSRSYLVGKSQVFLRSYVLPQLQLRRSSVKSSAAKGDTSFSSPLHLDTTKNTTITLVASPRSKDVKDTNVAYNSHSQQSRLTVTELKYPVPVPSSVEWKIGNHTSSPIANMVNPIPANKNLQQYLDAKARQDQSLIRANSPVHGPALLSGLISENLETPNSPWSNPTRKVNGVHGGTSIRPLDQDSSARSHPINQRSGDQAESKIVGDLRTEQIPTTKQGAPLPQHRQVVAPFTGNNGSTRKCSNLCPQTEILGGVRAFLDEDHNYSTNDESAINEDAYLALKDKFDRAQKVIEQTRQQVEQLTLEIKQKEANIMDLRNQLLDTRSRSNEAQVQLGVVEGNVQTLTNERDRAETLVKSLEKQLAHSNAQISVLQTQLKEANEKMRSLSANLDEQDRLPDKNKLNANRENESKELTSELVELRQTRQSFMLQLAELRSELEEARQDLTIAEQARSRAEQHLNQLRSESQRLIEEREAELDETRATNHARLRHLEEQLDAAQQELSQATRDRLKLEHELDEARTELFGLRDSIDPDTERKLRKELKKCQTLLAEKEELCERLLQQPSAEQALIKELRDRIDHLDEEKDAITRQKRALQTELDEAVTQASGLQRLKKELEDQLCTAKRETIDLQTQVDDHREAMKDTQRLHQSALAARSIDATTIEAQTQEINELLKERDALRSQVDELQTKLSASDLKQVQRTNTECLEAKIRELESRLDLEQSNRARLQASLDRARETIQQLTTERDKLLISENAERQQNRKLSRQLREAQQEQDETARRALQAQRRADEALTHADQAIRQATSSRVELSVMSRRTHELEAWVNEHQLNYLLDDFRLNSPMRRRSLNGSEFARSHRSPNSRFSISSGASGSVPSSPPRAASPPMIEAFVARPGAVSNT